VSRTFRLIGPNESTCEMSVVTSDPDRTVCGNPAFVRVDDPCSDPGQLDLCPACFAVWREDDDPKLLLVADSGLTGREIVVR
jgi:hypothetical protein